VIDTVANLRDAKTMNNQWQAFLKTRSAEIDAQGNVRFPGAPDDPECALCDLSQLGLIAATGADAEQFLQGQLTNDVRRLSQAHTQLSSHCSPKGRMLASFRILRLGDTFYLQLPRSNLQAALRRLQMYTLRAQVYLTDATDRLVAIGLSGACSTELLKTHIGALPESDNDMTHQGALSIVKIPGGRPRFLGLGPVEAMEPLWDALAVHADVVNADHWALLDIRAGIPTVYPETSEAFVPQMTNLHLIEGVSFDKGCYTGQEVVARMQYLGKLKRRMYWAQVETDRPPRPGDEVHAPARRSEQAAGQVVDARPAGAGRYELLVVVEESAADSGDVRLGAAGPQLSLKEPPYGLTDPS
jgi:folate-binding protein YgfZ